MADWTTLAVGALTATAAVVGAVGAQVAQAVSSSKREQREARRETREARRQAFIALLAVTEEIDSSAAGAAVANQRWRVPLELGSRLQVARSTARFYASHRTWAEMTPWIEAVAVRSNAVGFSDGASPQLQAEILAKLDELGGNDETRLDDLRERFIVAALQEINSSS
jgi:hypothetical protein